jgi:NitT/TauT family transport system substrate-binding protein
MKGSWRYLPSLLLLLTLLVSTLAACGGSSNTSTGPITVHLAYFTGIHHMAAHIGLSRKTYENALKPNKLETTVFNVGVDEVNAMAAKSLDIGFIGSGPPVNGYVKSNGSLLRVIAGAGAGGQLFIVQSDENITRASDLHGKKIADPGTGGTQDVSLRYYLKKHGLTPKDKGGDVEIVPGSNSDSVTLFKQHQIDGAWIPEPFASRMVLEGKGKIFVDERDEWPTRKFPTAVVIVRTEFLNQHPDIVKAFVKAEVETVQFINQNFAEAKKLDNEYLANLPGGKPLSQEVLDRAFSSVEITYDPLAPEFFTAADHQYELGFLGNTKPDLKKLMDLESLNSVLTDKSLPKVTTS